MEITGLDREVLSGWSVVAANGFLMPLDEPVPVETLLCRKWGISPPYLQDRIQTVLLNSRPVDDPKTIGVYPHDTITLSGAMPGLAGTMLRKGGVLAGMRHTISARNRSADIKSAGGWVTVKLFNLVISDLQSLFLGRGIVLPAEQASAFLASATAAIPKSNWRLWLDAQLVAVDTLHSAAETTRLMELRIVPTF